MLLLYQEDAYFAGLFYQNNSYFVGVSIRIIPMLLLLFQNNFYFVAIISELFLFCCDYFRIILILLLLYQNNLYFADFFIQNNANGQRLKDMIVENLIVKEALEYIQLHAPQIKTLLA